MLRTILTCGLLLLCAGARAQVPGGGDASASGTPSFLPQHTWGNWYFAGQLNFVGQEHGAFPSLYSGPNSLVNHSEDALSRVITFFSGYRLSDRTEILVDVEESGGSGLSGVLGLAGFTNLDAVRNPELGTAPYLARVMVHHVWNLGGGEEDAEATPLSTFTRLPRRRLELRLGKFSLVDFFDSNDVSGDSHYDFLNWTIANNGAYDYAADTRGYTQGAMLELDLPAFSARFAETLMPKVANGIAMEYDLSRGRADNLELEFRPAWTTKPVVRLLGYDNLANMGVYRDAINTFLSGQTATPEITNHPFQPQRKWGYGINLQDTLTPALAMFARWGEASGRYESFAYTEAETSLSLGAELRGSGWGRDGDRVGLAAVGNGISGDHQRYLADGGLGFLLGDGGLSYGHERAVEGFYTAAVTRGLSVAPDIQYVVNPGYNHARGPVLVGGLRLHLEF